MSTLVPAFILVVVVLMVVLVVVGGVQAKRRQETLSSFAASRGWTFTDRDDSLCERFAGRPFGTGSSRKAVNVLRGTLDDRSMVAFDYSYVTTSTSTDAQGHATTDSTTHAFSVVALNTGVVMPALTVTPEGLFSRWVGKLTGSDLTLGSEAFDRAFTVTCPSRRFAEDVLHPAMRELVLQWPDLAWRFDADSLVAVRSGSHDPTQVDATLAALGTILDQIPEPVWQELRGR